MSEYVVVRGAKVKISLITGIVIALLFSALATRPYPADAATAPAESIYAPSNTYAKATHRTYRYSVVVPASGSLHNIHIGVPPQAVLPETATLISPSYSNKGTAVRYPTYFDYTPPAPAHVDAGLILEFVLNDVTNPPPSTAGALIEAWNYEGERFISLTTSPKTFELAPLPAFSDPKPYPVPDKPCSPAPYSTAGENALPGDGGWRLSQPADLTAPQIEGYADRTSAACGQTVKLRVNVTDGSATFGTRLYRYGWYGGDKGRLVKDLGASKAVRQKTRVTSVVQRSLLDSSPRVTTDARTWTVSRSFVVQPNYTPGYYLLVLTSSQGFQTNIPLIIRDDTSHSEYVVASGALTNQAYNRWGGASLYIGVTGNNDDQAVTDDFERPYGSNLTSDGQFRIYEAGFVSWAEQRGLAVSYIADDDLDDDTARLSQHRTLVVLTHLEYWTAAMRQHVDAAVAAGMNLANFGANQAYWQVLLKPGPTGLPDRTVYTYRTCAPDPVGLFSAPGCYGSSQALFGVQYNCVGVAGDAVAQDNWLWKNTQTVAGQKVFNLLGGETDYVTPGYPQPAGLQILSHSPLSLCRNVPTTTDYSDMTYYRNAAGGQVFSGGTLRWICALDGACSDVDPALVSQLTQNVLDQLHSTQPPPGWAAAQRLTATQQKAAAPRVVPRPMRPLPVCPVPMLPGQPNCAIPGPV
jgi:hypothetical protein